jgi:chromosomal replication initiator protein
MTEQELDTIWERISEHVRKHTSKDTFQRWFSAARLEARGERELVVSVPNQIYQFWIESNYLPTLKLAATAVTGEDLVVRFTVGKRPAKAREADPAPGAKPEAGAGRGGGAGRAGTGRVALPPAGGGDGAVPAGGDADPPAPGDGAVRDPVLLRRMAASGLNERYSFASFVVGAGNQFAHAASVNVAKCPARSYNPLFIYGRVGLGKTHLMQAIGSDILARHAKMKVLYVTAETFVNAFIDAVAEGTLVKLRKRFRQVDALLIDDIQFLAGKERSQEEFFHTFNALSDGNRQIVLTSDRPPSEISTLEERLVSRFEWGLNAHLEPPDVETRIAILHTKMAALGVPIAEDVVRFIADHVRSNVRRLEGALMRVASLGSLYGRQVAVQEAEVVLRDVLEEEVRPAVTIDRIQRKIAEHFDIRLADITGKRRPAGIAFPRQVAMYLSRVLTEASFAEIGEAFGGRDHGTVMHACRVVKKRMDENDSLRRLVAQLIARIKGDSS